MPLMPKKRTMSWCIHREFPNLPALEQRCLISKDTIQEAWLLHSTRKMGEGSLNGFHTKLTNAHFTINPKSGMNVKMAAQIMSQSTITMLDTFLKGQPTESRSRKVKFLKIFIDNMDKAFNIQNGIPLEYSKSKHADKNNIEMVKKFHDATYFASSNPVLIELAKFPNFLYEMFDRNNEWYKCAFRNTQFFLTILYIDYYFL